ncbi:hypothetical protein [Streptomyces sp. NPDC018584]|uniref:hypothetical protein n=1 Tax=unclassified Streptomyces TaxID=2593676 RepID=UPI0037B1E5CE
MATGGFTEKRRQALCAWLTANDVDPNRVPLHSNLSIIANGDGSRHIHYTEFIRDEETGNILADADGHPRTRDVRVPCIADPPAWLHIPTSGARS